MEHLLQPTDKNDKQIKIQQIIQTKQKHVKTKKSLRTFGKTAKINFKERTPKYFYRTKVG